MMETHAGIGLLQNLTVLVYFTFLLIFSTDGTVQLYCFLIVTSHFYLANATGHV